MVQPLLYGEQEGDAAGVPAHRARPLRPFRNFPARKLDELSGLRENGFALSAAVPTRHGVLGRL